MWEEWREHALREAREYCRLMAIIMWLQAALAVVIFGAAIYFDLDVKWLIAIGFVGLVFVIWSAVITVTDRLDAGRSWLEQCCRNMNDFLFRDVLG